DLRILAASDDNHITGDHRLIAVDRDDGIGGQMKTGARPEGRGELPQSHSPPNRAASHTEIERAILGVQAGPIVGIPRRDVMAVAVQQLAYGFPVLDIHDTIMAAGPCPLP